MFINYAACILIAAWWILRQHISNTWMSSFAGLQARIAGFCTNIWKIEFLSFYCCFFLFLHFICIGVLFSKDGNSEKNSFSYFTARHSGGISWFYHWNWSWLNDWFTDNWAKKNKHPSFVSFIDLSQSLANPGISAVIFPVCFLPGLGMHSTTAPMWQWQAVRRRRR